MRRRQYLQAAALGASGLAGCNALNQGTDTPTDTPKPTVTPTATPGEEAPNVDPPAYMELLPKQHLKGTDETPNANFVRVDWDWYLSNYDTEMQFGATSEEDWTLEANAGNLNERPPPQYRLLHTPVGTTIQTAGIVANIIPLFPNLGPELVRQCGMEMVTESGYDDSRATYSGAESAQVTEIISYASPGITFFIGIDVNQIKSAIQSNEKSTNENAPETIIYAGSGRMDGRLFFVSEAGEQPILGVQSSDEADEAIAPAVSLVTGLGATESATSLESIRWCLSRFHTSAPVVVGQVNGGRAKFSYTNYVMSPIRNLAGYDTVFNGMKIHEGVSATAEVVSSHTDGKAPAVEQLQDLYGPEDGAIDTESHPSVSKLQATWDS